MTLLLLARSTAGAPPPPPPPAGLFDGVTYPRVKVMAGVGSGGTMQEITVDSAGRYALRSYARNFGRATGIDSADPGACTLVWNNGSGDYDQTNAGSVFMGDQFAATDSDTSPTVNYSVSGQTSPSSSGCTNSIVTAVTGGVLHDAGGASAATPNGTNPAAFPGPQTYWNDTPNGGTYNWTQVRQRLRVDTDQTTGVGLYYAHQGATSAANGVDFANPWYQGLQANGALGGKCWNAAIWNGVDAVAGDLAGTYAGPFSGEGDGYQLQAQFSWVAGRVYTMLMAAEPSRGPRWFSFKIKDETTGTVTWLGSIRAAATDASYVRGVAYNFTELFSQASPATTCPLLPRSTAFFGQPVFSAGSGGLDIGTRVQVFMEWPLGTNHPRFDGTIRKFSLDAGLDPTVIWSCADGLERFGRTPTAAGPRTFTSTFAGVRIDDLATLAGWTAGRDIEPTAHTPIWSTMTMGDSILELMHKLEMTEMGLLYVDEAGVLVFRDRYYTTLNSRALTPQLSLSDSSEVTAPGDIPLIELPNYERSTERVSNDIHLTREADPGQDPDVTKTEPGDEPSEMVAQDVGSIGPSGSRYGYLNLPAEVGKLHASDAAVADQANMLLAWYSLPADRIDQVTLNALHPRIKTNSLYDELLSLTLLDRIAVSRDYGPRTITGQLLIQGLAEEVDSDPPSWTITLSTTNPTPAIPRFILGVSVLGTDPIGW